MELRITEKDCENFPGRWSLNPEQVYTALSHVTYRRVLKILEFGSGKGTYVMARMLNRKGIRFKYVTYENDERFVCDHPKVQTVFWTDFPKKLVKGIYDLVIIDGPAGLTRTQWYPLLRSHVRQGTILLIDDFRHFKQFLKVLKRNFRYRLIHEVAEPKVPGRAQVTWRVVQVVCPKGKGFTS